MHTNGYNGTPPTPAELAEKYEARLEGEVNGHGENAKEELIRRGRASSENPEIFVRNKIAELAKASLNGTAPRYDNGARTGRDLLKALIEELHPTRVELSVTYGDLLNAMVDEQGEKVKPKLFKKALESCGKNEDVAGERIERALIRVAQQSLDGKAPRYDLEPSPEKFLTALEENLAPISKSVGQRNNTGWKIA